jgi:spermidine synthase
MSSGWRFGSWIAGSWDRLHRGRHVWLGIEEWIVRERSPFQEVAIARVPEFGRALFLDAVLQFAEEDEFVYHEHLALPPLLYHPAPRRVLIEGGGDGLALREVLRDPRVERAVLVDIDEVVVRACRDHLADLHRGSFDDPRAEIVVDDIRAYLARDPEPFDAVLVDLVDAYTAEEWALYAEVLPLTRRACAPGAVVAVHGDLAGPPYRFLYLYRELGRHFRHTAGYRAAVTSFTGDWGFALASDDLAFADMPTEVVRDRAGALRGPLRALVPETFPAAFRWPGYLEARLREIPEGAPPPPAAAGSAEWVTPEEG